MGKDIGTARTTITVPLALKKEMDEIDGLVRVNWSATAAEAFRRKILEVRATMDTKTMNDVVTRMKAAAKADQAEALDRGAEAGREWAKQYARPSQLRRLDNKYKGPDPDSERPLFDLCRVIGDEEHFDAFTEEVGVDPADEAEPEYARGFALGALEVWKQVRTKL